MNIFNRNTINKLNITLFVEIDENLLKIKIFLQSKTRTTQAQNILKFKITFFFNFSHKINLVST